MGRFFENIDWISLFLVLSISTFGLFTLLLVGSSFFMQQLLYLIIGFGIAVAVSRVNSAFFWWLAPAFYVFSVLFIMATYVAPEVRGAHRWIFFAGNQLQPSELVKPLVIIGFSRLISSYPPRQIRFILMHLAVFLLVFLLVYKQPDFGTAIIYGFAWLGMMLAGGLKVRILALTILAASVLVPFVWGTLEPYQKDRISSFINPNFDPLGVGYNAIQSVITVGSGEVFGRGLGKGTQSHLQFLPEYHTDFIFATLVEEFGFIGGMILIALYFVLLWIILLPLLWGRISDAFRFTGIIGIFCMILGQVVINMGMNMGLVPVTGITLPLVSYGGSSVLATMASFGVFWSYTKTDKRSLSVAM